MTHTYLPPSYGRAGDGTPHLPPQEGRPVYYQHGPFEVVLAPTMIQKAAGQLPDALWAGMLSAPPNADGDQYEELTADGCPRVLVRLTPYAHSLDGNVQPIAFHFSAGVSAKWMGLFDEDGRLLFYGALRGYQTRPGLPASFEFAAFAIKVKRFVLPAAGGPCQQTSGGRSRN